MTFFGLLLSLFLLNFQDPATPVMEGIIDLHNYIFFYLTLILLFTGSMLAGIIFNFYFRPFFADYDTVLNYRYSVFRGIAVQHHTILEIIWTLLPGFVLIVMLIPSFALLYAIDEIIMPGLIFKAVGFQWTWSYEYSNLNVRGTELPFWNDFDSYIVPIEDLSLGFPRLLEVDNAIILPTNVHVRILVTSEDVLHSWAVPSLGIKIDAVPGRLTQATFFLKREGTFYGQCSEICGIDHGFMPIVVKSLSLEKCLALYATSRT